MGASIGPLSQRGLDEALGRAVDARSAGPGADVSDGQLPAALAKSHDL